MENYEVFHPIYGLTISTQEPAVVGKFKFYNTKTGQYAIGQRYVFDIKESSDTYISVQVSEDNIDKAKEKATMHFIHMQNLFRMTLNNLLDKDFDVGIYNYRQPQRDSVCILSNNKSVFSSSAYGGYRKIDISSFLQMSHHEFIHMAEIITKNDKSELDNRKLIAMDFIGEGQNVFGTAVSVFQFVTAIDALLGKNEKGQKARFGKRTAYLLGDRTDLQTNIENEAGNLYDIRSKIAHGELNVVELVTCQKASKMAYKVFGKIAFNASIQKIERFSDLEKYIINKKC